MQADSQAQMVSPVATSVAEQHKVLAAFPMVCSASAVRAELVKLAVAAVVATTVVVEHPGKAAEVAARMSPP